MLNSGRWVVVYLERKHEKADGRPCCLLVIDGIAERERHGQYTRSGDVRDSISPRLILLPFRVSDLTESDHDRTRPIF
jgi:hypothetical protein